MYTLRWSSAPCSQTTGPWSSRATASGALGERSIVVIIDSSSSSSSSSNMIIIIIIMIVLIINRERGSAP